MNIEKMTINDIDEVFTLEKELFVDPWPKHFFFEELENEFANYYVYKNEEEIIGYAGMWQMFENCDLTNIAIKKEQQGKGYGKELLKFMIKEALKRNCEFMHLEVRVSNTKAKNLYEKLGFEQTRIRKHYYENGEDCIDMVKGLLGLNEEDFSD